MATWPVEASKPETYIDDSEYERFDGMLRARAVPGLEHATRIEQTITLLRPFAVQVGGEVHHEWSISDGSGNWLTPDVTFSYPDFKTTHRGHLLIPAFLVVEVRSTDQPLKELFDKREQYRRWQTAFYWIIDPVETACYECPMSEAEFAVIVPRKDTLRAGTIEIAVRDVFGSE